MELELLRKEIIIQRELASHAVKMTRRALIEE